MIRKKACTWISLQCSVGPSNYYCYIESLVSTLQKMSYLSCLMYSASTNKLRQTTVGLLYNSHLGVEKVSTVEKSSIWASKGVIHFWGVGGMKHFYFWKNAFCSISVHNTIKINSIQKTRPTIRGITVLLYLMGFFTDTVRMPLINILERLF